ncbi:MAG: hypothetical protein HY471_00440 [Candidatus Sungbacteria bacterium]|nr:hypothetical protein [Candidatus Sungbacteria bacterium]
MVQRKKEVIRAKGVGEMTQVRFGDRRGFARRPQDTERQVRVVERLFSCPLLGGGEVNHEGCTRLSGSPEHNPSGCREEKCESPWRLCAACVVSRAEHPRLSQDSIFGFCSQHQRDGERVLREHAPRPQPAPAAPAPHEVRESNGAAVPIGKPVVTAVPDSHTALEHLAPTEAAVTSPNRKVVAAEPPPAKVEEAPVSNGPVVAAAPVPEVTPPVVEAHPPAAAEVEETATVTPSPSEDGGRDEFAVLAQILEMQRRFPQLTHPEIAARFGRTGSWAGQHISLLRLSPKVVELMDLTRPRDRRIGYSLAVLHLVRFDHTLQEELAQEVLGKPFGAAVQHIRERTSRIMPKRGLRKPREEKTA